ncbi:hypothetical protein [Botrimarina sp.]|uniref:hypothetical protein n=1 Tax=Botrimarina sp. TaxID=2795802 RepID=UPI0032ECE64D
MDATIENLFTSAADLELRAWGLKRLAEESNSSNVPPDRVLAQWRQAGTIPGLELAAKVRRTDGGKDEAFRSLVAELEREVRRSYAQPSVSESDSNGTDGGDVQQSAYDLAVRLGVIGVVKNAPPDLSSNPKYLEGFGG